MTQSATEFAPWLGVFETLRVIDGKALLFAEHRAELARAMDALGLTSDADLAAEAARLPAKSGRWRWIVTPGETRTLFSEEAPIPAVPVPLSISPVRVGSHNWDARFKTISYLSHIQAGKIVSTPEAILLNEHGHVASASRGNVFWRRGERLFTPAHEAGCRCGVVRAFVLQQGGVEQGNFPASDLLDADEIFVTNSMRGIVSASAISGRPIGCSRYADALRERYENEIAFRLKNRLPIRS